LLIFGSSRTSGRIRRRDVFAIIGFQTAKVFALLQSVMDDVLRKQLIRIAFLLARTVLTGLLAAPSVSPPPPRVAAFKFQSAWQSPCRAVSFCRRIAITKLTGANEAVFRQEYRRRDRTSSQSQRFQILVNRTLKRLSVSLDKSNIAKHSSAPIERFAPPGVHSA